MPTYQLTKRYITGPQLGQLGYALANKKHRVGTILTDAYTRNVFQVVECNDLSRYTRFLNEAAS